jgi:hypothetical protein
MPEKKEDYEQFQFEQLTLIISSLHLDHKHQTDQHFWIIFSTQADSTKLQTSHHSTVTQYTPRLKKPAM